MPQLQLVITYDPSTSQLGLQGSPELINNQVMVFGVLDLTKAIIFKNAQDNERRVQPVSAMPPGFPGN
jgi:hypothetical protein